MTAYSELRSKHATLSGTLADTVTLTGKWSYIEVINRDDEEDLWVSVDPDGAPTAASAGADDTLYVPPLGSKIIKYGDGVISVVGDGNAYSVEGFSL